MSLENILFWIIMTFVLILLVLQVFGSPELVLLIGGLYGGMFFLWKDMLNRFVKIENRFSEIENRLTRIETKLNLIWKWIGNVFDLERV